MVKVVFFDLGDTLTHPVPLPEYAQGRALCAFLCDAGFTVTAEDVAATVDAGRSREPAGAGDCYGAWFRVERQRIAALLESIGQPQTNDRLDRLAIDFRKYRDARITLFPDVRPTFEALRGMGLGISVISNNDGRTVAHVERHGLAPWVDHVIDSAAFGCTKPNPAIYRFALARAAVAAAEAAMVGDSAKADALGAAAAGLRPFWLNRRDEKNHPDARVTTIRSLTEIPPLLAKICDNH